MIPQSYVDQVEGAELFSSLPYLVKGRPWTCNLRYFIVPYRQATEVSPSLPALSF